MLLIKTKIGPSKIHGIGLFADQNIAKDTPIWKFQPGFDIKIDKSELKKLSNPARKAFLHYDYLNLQTKKHILCFDDARFFNHSDFPNVLALNSDDEEGVDVAARDIQKGEEMTIDYKSYDGSFSHKLGKS